jgi:hypothetical protein
MLDNFIPYREWRRYYKAITLSLVLAVLYALVYIKTQDRIKLTMLRFGPILTAGEEDSINTAKKGLIKYFCFIIQYLIVVAVYRILYLVFDDP